MYRIVKSSKAIFAMSNVLGRFIKVEENVPFSFYYSPRNSSHGPRVKPVLNPEKMRISDAGTLALSGSWKFIPGKNDKSASEQLVDDMKKFFRKYLVLFLLVWEGIADDPALGYYLEGRLDLSEFIKTLDFYEKYQKELDAITSVQELEQFCRDHNLVNMYEN